MFFYQTFFDPTFVMTKETSTTQSQVAACIPPATPYRLLNPKWPTGGPKMAYGVWKGV